ncbi:MAG: hypothetical protein R3A48_13640 [Polyangiales bacterium]
MLARFAERWDPEHPAPFFVRGGALDLAAVIDSVRDAQGPSRCWAPPSRSCTSPICLDARTAAPPLRAQRGHADGRLQGRAREVSEGELRALLSRVLEVDRAQVVGEYGMTELSSQAWEVAPGRFRAPPWMRVTPIDPNTLARKEIGEVGLLRCHDLLNLGSSAAVLTSDLGVLHGDGTFSVLGRAAGATPRGCARAMDHLLLGAR